MVITSIKGFSKIEQVLLLMNPKTMQPLSPEHPDSEWGSCQDLQITSCKNHKWPCTSTVQLFGVELFIAALMMADVCFGGISDLIFDP